MAPPSKTKVISICRCVACVQRYVDRCHRDPSIDAAFVEDGAIDRVDEFAKRAPDVLIIDVDAWGGGFEIMDRARRASCDAEIALAGHQFSDIAIQQALAAGAKGILHIHEPVDDFVEHVHRLSAGEHRFSSAVAARLEHVPEQNTYRLRHESPIDSLSDTQLRILRLLAQGDSLKIVAKKLNLTRKSVDGHKYRIMKKIGLQDRVLLARFAIREGLIEP